MTNFYNHPPPPPQKKKLKTWKKKKWEKEHGKIVGPKCVFIFCANPATIAIKADRSVLCELHAFCY